MENFTPFPSFATNALHVGQEPERWKSMAVIPPISLSTTFKQFGPSDHTGFEYSRSGNPTRDCLEEALASLENAKHGMVFASGLAASNTLTMLLQQGDHIVSMDDVYGGTNRMFKQCTSRMGIKTTFTDMCDIEEVKKAVTPQTKMVWVETPTNPTLKLVDIAAVVEVTRKSAHKDCFVVVDNTFMSAYFQRPLDFGADVVMHSISKYMNGHSDVIMGCVCTSNDALAERIRFLQNAIGPVVSPFDSFLVNRGLKTLACRMKEHMSNGLACAKFLESHPGVEKVRHPGLPSHPQHELAKKQMRGYSGMVTVYVKGGKPAADAFLKALKLFVLAESLGGVESLAEMPSVMTHASVPDDERAKLGITDNMLRLSVGIEDQADLIQDLDQALKAAAAAVEL